jgi:hypothetical protein
MAAEMRTFLEIPDKSIGFVVGETPLVNIHTFGFGEQTVQVRFLLNDPLGATRFSLRDEERNLQSEHAVISIPVELGADFPSGEYLITAQVASESANFRAIETESFHVVTPGDRLPDGFPVAPGDHLVNPAFEFAPVEYGELEEAFHLAHAACLRSRNADGSWGKQNDGGKAAYRTPGNVTLGYLYAFEALGASELQEMAIGGLNYLVSEQEDSGAYRWWREGYPEGVMNQRDPFYDTGWAGLALAEGYRMTGDSRYLDATRRAADWTLTCPYTGNNNYDAFALWFLSLLYEFTGEARYLDSAIDRTKHGVFFAQLPRGGWPGHNFHIGYQSITVNGLSSLYDVLPLDHPFALVLKKRLCMGLNFASFLQDTSGDYFQGWEYDRDFQINEQGLPEGNSGQARSELIRAFYIAENRLDLPENIFNGLCQSILRRVARLRQTPGADANHASLMDIGLLLLWAHKKQGQKTCP